MSEAYYKGWQEGCRCFRLVGPHEKPANPYPTRSSERQEFYLGFCSSLETLSMSLFEKKNNGNKQ